MTQLAQAYCVKTEAEHYRRLQSDCAPGSPEGGCTMGSLFWMANAMWDGAEKSSLEWAGPARWKVLHHYSSRFYAPQLVSAVQNLSTGALEVWFSQHDATAGSISAGTLVLSVWSWSRGFVGNVTAAFTTNSIFGAERIWAGSVQGVLDAAGGCSPLTDCTLAYAAYVGSPRALLGDNFLFLTPMANVSTTRDPGLSITGVMAVPDSLGQFAVTYAAAALPAAAVWLESLLQGYFSDNAQLMTSSPVTVTFTAANASITPGELAASLSIWSLWDVAPYG